MINQCSQDVQILVDKNVMSSRTTASFALNQDVFGRCIDSGSNYFNQFCLFPPTEDLLTMCSDPNTYVPSFLFSQMLDYQFTSVADLPDVITYVRFSGNGDWSPQPQITPVVYPNVVLNESFTAHNEWFIGTTTVSAATLPNPLPDDTCLVRSHHQLMQLVWNSSRRAFELQFANVPNMILENQSRVVRLYDSGNLRIFANQADANDNRELWASETNDQYGSDAIFNELFYPLHSIAAGALGTMQSPNGAYLLVVTENRISIKFQAFNNARFTSSTLATGTIAQAVDAQSKFCFQAMNRNQGAQDLDFVDPRCNCIASDRLVTRVFDSSTFSTVPALLQLQLRDTTPCIMRKCQMLPGEFTNANLHLDNKCIGANGFCEAALPQANDDAILVVQNCLVDIEPCVTSATCPLGSSCRNRQCMLNCTSDIPCIRANPLASCVNGQCQMGDPNNPSSASNTLLWAAVGLAVGVLVVLLALILYFTAK